MLSGNVTKRQHQVGAEEGDRGVHTRQVSSGLKPPERESGPQLPRPLCASQDPSLYRPRCLQLTLALTTYSINRGEVGVCRSQRLPGLPEQGAGRAHGGPRGARPRPRLRLPGLLLPATGPATAAVLPPVAVARDRGKGLLSCLATEKPPKPPADSERGSGGARRGGTHTRDPSPQTPCRRDPTDQRPRSRDKHFTFTEVFFLAVSRVSASCV